ncbi:MAG: hypothetical protein JKY51_03165 [Opitutaceae bacterium]|nr:hypothetical protein [Opitutaceae bacterium]
MNSKSHLTTIVLVLLGSILLPISSHADERQSSIRNVQSLHSYVPIILYKGEFYPVVGVKNKKPLIKVDGRLVSMRKDSTAFFSANDFDVLPAIMTKRKVSTIDTGVGHGLSAGNFPGWEIGGFTNEVTVESGPNDESRIKLDGTTSLWEIGTPMSGSITNAYGVFLFYSDKGVAELHWRNLENTPEGETLSVKVPYLKAKTLKKHKRPRYLLLAYQDGEELVPSDNPQREDLLNWVQALSMAQISDSYAKVTQEEDADPTPIFLPNFDLSESEQERIKGKIILVNVIINQIGMITEVIVDSNIPAPIANKISDALYMWRFLPAIKEGNLVEQEVIIPLQF